MGITGEEDGPPVKVGVAVADICAGMFAAFGILAALRVRERTGRGQWVDAALLDGQVAWLTYAAANYFATGENPTRMGSAHPNLCPYQAFRTQDGYLNVAVGSEAIWKRFCEAVDPQLAEDPRFRTNRDRVRNRSQLIPLLQARFRERPTGEWIRILDEAGVPNGPIYAISEVFSDPQTLHRQMRVEVEHPRAGRVTVTGVPVKFSGKPGLVARPRRCWASTPAHSSASSGPRRRTWHGWSGRARWPWPGVVSAGRARRRLAFPRLVLDKPTTTC